MVMGRERKKKGLAVADGKDIGVSQLIMVQQPVQQLYACICMAAWDACLAAALRHHHITYSAISNQLDQAT
jgi:hypothetical protein